MKWLTFTCNIHFVIKGRSNIPDTPCVIVANHQSTWETLFLYKIFRPQFTLLKRELLWIPIFGWGLKLLKPVAIDRGKKHNALNQIIREVPKKISQGFWYASYPEGTRVETGKIVPYAASSSLIASKGGIDILPIAHNSGYCWPPKTILKKPGTITLHIGPVIKTEGLKTKELSLKAETWIRATQKKLEPKCS